MSLLFSQLKAVEVSALVSCLPSILSRSNSCLRKKYSSVTLHSSFLMGAVAQLLLSLCKRKMERETSKQGVLESSFLGVGGGLLRSAVDLLTFRVSNCRIKRFFCMVFRTV